MDSIEKPKPVTDIERNWFYYEVGGKLVARTSTWEYSGSGAWWPGGADTKSLKTIGQHDIVSKWSDSLVQSLYSELEDSRITWSRFYPIKLCKDYGDHEGPRESTVLMIEVPPDHGLGWEVAVKAALACQEILRRVEISDVDVQIREINRSFFAMDTDLEKKAEALEMNKRMILEPCNLNFLSHLGYPIAPASSDSYYGTLGLYVRLSGRKEVYGLTCRHVVHRPGKQEMPAKPEAWLEDHEGYHLGNGDQDEPRHQVVQLCPRLLKLERDRLEDGLSHAEWKLESFSEDVRKKQEPADDDQIRLEFLARQLSLGREIYQTLSDTKFDTAEGRTIGYIAEMPPLQVSSRGHIRDWALVRLNENKSSSPPTNSVLFDRKGESFRNFSCWFCNPRRDEGVYDFSRLLRRVIENSGKASLQGTLSAEEISKRESIGVCKRGATSGLTFGHTDEIKSVVRCIGPDGRSSPAWEWIVLTSRLHHETNFGNNYSLFAQVGDSGAAVFDMAGRIIGMIDGGIVLEGETSPSVKIDKTFRRYLEPEEWDRGASEEDDADSDRFFLYPHIKDVTLVVPIQEVFQDIEEKTGCKVEII